MNKVIISTILLLSIYGYQLESPNIETEQQLITIFNCTFYNTINNLDFYINELYINISVNQKKRAIYIKIIENINKISFSKYKFGVINICSDSYKRFICNPYQCMSDKLYIIKIDSTLRNLNKFLIYNSNLPNYL